MLTGWGRRCYRQSHMTNLLYPDHTYTTQFVILQGRAPSLAATVAVFLEALVGKNRSAGTIRAYRADLAQFVQWLGATNGAVSHAGQVTKADLAAYLTHLGHAGLSGVSRARKLAAIREYFRFLVEHGVIPGSPAVGITTPKREQKSRVWLRPDEYSRMLSLAGAHPRDYAILQVFLQTGVRVSELADLRTDDVDLPGRTLRVRGKGQVERVIELEKKAVAALKRWTDTRPRVLDDHLFLNYQGTPLSDRSIRELVAKYREQAGIPKKATPHSLRHTFGSYKAQKGVPLRQVQEWLGHKSLATTQLYLHLDKQDAHKAMEATSL